MVAGVAAAGRVHGAMGTAALGGVPRVGAGATAAACAVATALMGGRKGARGGWRRADGPTAAAVTATAAAAGGTANATAADHDAAGLDAKGGQGVRGHGTLLAIGRSDTRDRRLAQNY